MQPLDTPYDVIIAGAGPVGLFLACELRLGGASVLVLEQAPDPHSLLKGLPFGLRGLSLPTIESLDRRDLLKKIEACAASKDTRAAAHWMQQQRRPAGHFAGIQFFHDQIDSARWPYRLPGPVGSLAVDMASIETVFAERADMLGWNSVAAAAWKRLMHRTPASACAPPAGHSTDGGWSVAMVGAAQCARPQGSALLALIPSSPAIRWNRIGRRRRPQTRPPLHGRRHVHLYSARHGRDGRFRWRRLPSDRTDA